MKQGYINMRNKQELDNAWLWEYYKSNGGYLNSPDEFIEHFYFEKSPIQVNGKTVGFKKANRDLSHFFSDKDRKFELQTLWSKEGTFIKVVE